LSVSLCVFVRRFGDAADHWLGPAEPTLLLLDEHTSSLDARRRARGLTDSNGGGGGNAGNDDHHSLPHHHHSISRSGWVSRTPTASW
jgi:hypothetical protein